MKTEHPCIKRVMRDIDPSQAVQELGQYLDGCDYVCARLVGDTACKYFTRFDNMQNGYDEAIRVDTTEAGIDCQLDTAKKAAHHHYANGGVIDLTRQDRQPIALPSTSMDVGAVVGQGAIFSELASNAFDLCDLSDAALGSF